MLRTELSKMIAMAEKVIALDEHAVLATLLYSSGSTYRPLGSMMVSAFPSMIAGGVSGGCLEQYIARAGRSLTNQNPATMLSFDTDPDGDNDEKPILGCGGAIDVLVERLTPSHIEFLKRMREACTLDACSAAACMIHTVKRQPMPSVAVRRLWCNNGCQESDDPPLARLHQRAIADRHSRHGVLDASGARRALVYYIPPMTRLVVIGAGNGAQPLCSLARSLGWHVTVTDRRGRLATKSRFPDADEIVVDEWSGAFDKITFTPHTAVVMMTHSLPDDTVILPLLHDRPMTYLGVLGPEHRLEWLLNGIADRTELNDEFTAKVHGPIGLNLGDRSASGIAVSVVAEILACFNGRDAKPLSQRGQYFAGHSRPVNRVAHA